MHHRQPVFRLTISSGLLVLSLALLAFAGGCSRSAPSDSDAASIVGPSLDTYELEYPKKDTEYEQLSAALKLKIEQIGGFAFFRQPESDDLSSIPQDPMNPLTPEKVALGQLLFNEVGMGVNNVRAEGYQTYTCATCHPNQSSYFSPLPQAIAEGGSGFGNNGEARVCMSQYDSNPDKPDVQQVRAPSVINKAFQNLSMRNGRLGAVGMNVGTSAVWNSADGSDNNALGHHGLETQAIAGLAEHRMGDMEYGDVGADPTYQAMFAAAFPGNPVVSRYNAALAIAAFERTILTNQAPFQRWLRGEKNALNKSQVRGALLFFGKGGCNVCHTGPALNSMTFWGVGMGDLDMSADPARVHLEPFGGAVSDAMRRGRGGFTGNFWENYTFKTPQLYNLKDSSFFGHGSTFTSVREVVEYYNVAVKQNPYVPQSAINPFFVPLHFVESEIVDLTEFLENGLYDPNMSRFSPGSTPLGMCFPANDTQSQIDLGCSGASSSPLSLRPHGRQRPTN